MNIELVLYGLLIVFVNFLITTLIIVRYDIQVSNYIDKKIEQTEEE